MAGIVGANTERDGLVFQYDMSPITRGQPGKSWKGKPTTNLAKNVDETIDFTTGNLSQSITITTVIANERFRITSTSLTGSAWRMSFDAARLTNGETYTMSYKYTIISGGTLFGANDWCDTAITKTTTDLGNGVFYETATGTRGTYDGTYSFMDFNTSDNTVVDIWDIQLEAGSYASPYSKSSRSTTESLVDISGNGNTITATSLTYNSDNTFSFNGTTNELSTPVIDGLGIATESHTFEVWCSPNSASGDIVNMTTGVGWGMCPIWIESSIIRGKVWSNATLSALSTVTFGQYYHIVFTYNHPGSISSLYVNGELQSTAAGTYSSSGADNFINIGQAGNQATGTFFNGSVPIFKVYRNTSLTANEVLQNFEAARSRYGI